KIVLPGAKGGTPGTESEQERAEKALEEAFGGGKSPSAPAPSGAAPGAGGASPAPQDAPASGSGEQDDATKALEKAMGNPKPDGGK
ncbi:MAG TPA: LytR family transcriptional regulator, partial [Casimicrobiaceae bacterium]|nr:LytR family transcriptional regulator [Casimicrobiaceae bacterium]